MPNDQTPKLEDAKVAPESQKLPTQSAGKDDSHAGESKEPGSELDKALKKLAKFEKDNFQQREQIRQFAEAQKQAEEKALAEQGKWEQLSKTKDDEITTQFKPALEGLKAENERLKKVVQALLESELAKLTNQNKEVFEKLYPNISDPAEKLDRLRVWQSVSPSMTPAPHVNSGLPASSGGMNPAEQARLIHKSGTPQQKGQLYSSVAQ